MNTRSPIVLLLLIVLIFGQDAIGAKKANTYGSNSIEIQPNRSTEVLETLASSYHSNAIGESFYQPMTYEPIIICSQPCIPDAYYRYISKRRVSFPVSYGHSYPNNYISPSYSEPINPYFGSSMYGVPAYDYYRYYPTAYYPNYYPSYSSYYPSSYYHRQPKYKKDDKIFQPRYLGRGEALLKENRIAELICKFDDPTVKIVSNVAWVKIIGPYKDPKSDHRLRPTDPMEMIAYECDGCSYSYIGPSQHARFRVLTEGAVSVLQIFGYIPEDCGMYRCTATGLTTDGKTETLYQIVEFYNFRK